MNKENYRPVSLLSHMSEVFERILYNQFNDLMKDKLSNILTGFEKVIVCNKHCYFIYLFIYLPLTKKNEQ